MIDRTERQKQCVSNWINSGGNASLCLCTGFGKTRCAGMIIQRYLKANPAAKILITVPSEVLKTQWIENLVKWKLFDKCNIQIINTVIKKTWVVDLLVIDEVHKCGSDTFSTIFQKVSYQNVLCLTGTMNRLDGKEAIVKKYAPICDEITAEEAIANGWLSPYREYKVLIDVDLTEYNEINRKFNLYFSYFDYNFNLAMALMANKSGYRNKYAKKMGLNIKEVTAMTFDWMRCMRERKNFVQNHPKKIEICHKILESRKNKKAITFSTTIENAEKIKYGKVLSSKQSKKSNKITKEEFDNLKFGVLNSSKALDEGFDCKNLSLGIILSCDSSSIRKQQRLGRILRVENDKVAEMFTLVIRGTQEDVWFNNSVSSNYTTINEEELDLVLAGENLETRQRNNVKNIDFRF